MRKGINLTALLGSDIFCFKIKFEEWPEIHWCRDEVIMPYNGSLFEIRQSYEVVFGKDDVKKEFDSMDKETIEDILTKDADDHGDDKVKDEDKKVYKTTYSVNLLPMSFVQAQSKYVEN